MAQEVFSGNPTEAGVIGGLVNSIVITPRVPSKEATTIIIQSNKIPP
jgi:hypothetical protein